MVIRLVCTGLSDLMTRMSTGNWCGCRLRAKVVIGLVCTGLSDLMTRMSTGNWCGCRLRA